MWMRYNDATLTLVMASDQENNTIADQVQPSYQVRVSHC